MRKQSSDTLRSSRRMVAIRLHQLIDEVRLLTSAFPDLRDAFDPDELPIDFILKRDAPSEASGSVLHRPGGKQSAPDD